MSLQKLGNFGPSDEGSITVEEVVQNVKKHWDKIDYEINKIQISYMRQIY